MPGPRFLTLPLLLYRPTILPSSATHHRPTILPSYRVYYIQYSVFSTILPSYRPTILPSYTILPSPSYHKVLPTTCWLDAGSSAGLGE